MERNGLLVTKGNRVIDDLLLKMQNSTDLSENFRCKIVTICDDILSDGKEEFSTIEIEINKFISLMKALKVFSAPFILEISESLRAGLNFEKNK